MVGKMGAVGESEIFRGNRARKLKTWNVKLEGRTSFPRRDIIPPARCNCGADFGLRHAFDGQGSEF